MSFQAAAASGSLRSEAYYVSVGSYLAGLCVTKNSYVDRGSVARLRPMKRQSMSYQSHGVEELR